MSDRIYEKVMALLREIAELEASRDRIGRHTSISATFEMLMNKHAELFNRFDVKQLPSKSAL